MTAFESTPNQEVRKLAVQILTKVETRKAYADVLLDHALKSAILDDRDRSLLTELTYGTLRWRGRLDALLKRRVRKPLQASDPFIRNLLRLALYQLQFLDRIPDYAAVNEAVELAKDHAGKGAGGFVNGLLRNVLRGEKRLPEPKPDETSIATIAEFWSHPDWLVKRWLEYFGNKEIQSLLRANNDRAPLILRTNRLRCTREKLLSLLRADGVEAAPACLVPQGININTRLPVDRIPGIRDGYFQIQGEAAQLVAYLLDPKRNDRILDACAAPGGKAAQIAELIDDHGEIIAADVAPAGIRRIEENIGRLGLRSVRAVHADLRRDLPSPLDQPYDRVLVDAPCSGLGTLRSHPEIKWHRRESDILRLKRLQKVILSRAGSYLKSGGVLVYSTCTLSQEENENVVENFLETHAEFVLEDAAGYLPEQAGHMVRGSYFLALPHRDHTDGFFAARMRKVA